MEDYKYANTPMGQAFQKASAGSEEEISGKIVLTGDDEDVVTRRFKGIKIPDGEISGFITYDNNKNKFRIDIERLNVRRSGTPAERYSLGWMMIPRADNEEVDTAALGSAITKMNRQKANSKFTPNEERQLSTAIINTVLDMDAVRGLGQEEQEDLV